MNLKSERSKYFNEPEMSYLICHLDFNHSDCVIGHSYNLKRIPCHVIVYFCSI